MTSHWSSCAVHNEPALPKGECDCGGMDERRMTFWAALCESMLDLMFGHDHLRAWREEKAQREECERVCEEHRRAAELAR